MRPLFLTCCSLLLGASLRSEAQTSISYPRYYLGLGLCASDYQPLRVSSYRGITVPVQFTAGYQLRPRLAVQANVAYSSMESSYFNAGKYPASSTTATPDSYFEYTGQYSSHTISTALLARYTLTRQAAHRLQLDVLGGFTLVNQHSTRFDTHTYIDSNQNVTSSDSNTMTDEQHDLLLTAGVGARYRLGRHLEASLDATLSRNLGLARNVSFPSGASLGLRYRFGHG